MKRVGYIYENICDIDNIKRAILNASKGKRHQRTVKKIIDNIDHYAFEIHWMLLTKTYKPSKYIVEKLKDGANKKERIISKPKFYPDQIIHWALMQQIQPIIMKGMYEYCCGSVPGRGSSKGQKAIRRWLDNDHRCTKYCLQMDVSKFYPSIDAEKVKAIFRTKIKDESCLCLIDSILDSSKGMPIGNYTSQWFANFYLQNFDHFIKSLPGVKYYVRYIDDLVIFGPNKKALHKSRIKISQYLNTLSLKLKPNWQVWKVDSRPVDFLGFKFYRDKTILRSRTSLRIKRRCKKISKKAYLNHKDASAIISYWGWIKRSNSYNFYNKNIKPYVSIKRAKKIISKHSKRRTKMDNLELIDRLCGITSEQAELIKIQAEIIEHSKNISAMSKQELKSTESKIDDELDLVEYACRKL